MDDAEGSDDIGDLMNMLPQKGKRKDISKLNGSRQKKVCVHTEIGSSDDEEDHSVSSTAMENYSLNRKGKDETLPVMRISKPSVLKITPTPSNIVVDIINLERSTASSDQIDKQAAELMLQLVSAKERLISSDNVSVKAPIKESTRSSRSMIIPKILTAEERMKEAAKLQTQNTTVVKNAIDLEMETSAGNNLKCSVRLNGHYTSSWKISSSDSFGKFRSLVAAYFEVAPKGLKFKFDGETLKDSDTFQSVGIEDDDMIDAEVDKALYPTAVKKADEKKNRVA
eukprot:gene28080-36969_t